MKRLILFLLGALTAWVGVGQPTPIERNVFTTNATAAMRRQAISAVNNLGGYATNLNSRGIQYADTLQPTNLYLAPGATIQGPDDQYYTFGNYPGAGTYYLSQNGGTMSWSADPASGKQPYSVFYLSTIAGLGTVAGSGVKTNAYVAGHTTYGDGGQGWFDWFAALPSFVTAVNGYTCYAGSSGYWIRRLPNNCEVWFEHGGTFSGSELSTDYYTGPLINIFNQATTDSRVTTISCASGNATFYAPYDIILNSTNAGGKTLDLKGATVIQSSTVLAHKHKNPYFILMMANNPTENPDWSERKGLANPAWFTFNMKNIHFIGARETVSSVDGLNDFWKNDTTLQAQGNNSRVFYFAGYWTNTVTLNNGMAGTFENLIVEGSAGLQWTWPARVVVRNLTLNNSPGVGVAAGPTDADLAAYWTGTNSLSASLLMEKTNNWFITIEGERCQASTAFNFNSVSLGTEFERLGKVFLDNISVDGNYSLGKIQGTWCFKAGRLWCANTWFNPSIITGAFGDLDPLSGNPYAETTCSAAALHFATKYMPSCTIDDITVVDSVMGIQNDSYNDVRVSKGSYRNVANPASVSPYGGRIYHDSVELDGCVNLAGLNFIGGGTIQNCDTDSWARRIGGGAGSGKYSDNSLYNTPGALSQFDFSASTNYWKNLIIRNLGMVDMLRKGGTIGQTNQTVCVVLNFPHHLQSGDIVNIPVVTPTSYKITNALITVVGPNWYTNTAFTFTHPGFGAVSSDVAVSDNFMTIVPLYAYGNAMPTISLIGITNTTVYVQTSAAHSLRDGLDSVTIRLVGPYTTAWLTNCWTTNSVVTVLSTSEFSFTAGWHGDAGTHAAILPSSGVWYCANDISRTKGYIDQQGLLGVGSSTKLVLENCAYTGDTNLSPIYAWVFKGNGGVIETLHCSWAPLPTNAINGSSGKGSFIGEGAATTMHSYDLGEWHNISTNDAAHPFTFSQQFGVSGSKFVGVKGAFTNTASLATSRIYEWYGGSGGTTLEEDLDPSGNMRVAGSVSTPSGLFGAVVVTNTLTANKVVVPTGLVSDGVTDNTPAIQAALNTASNLYAVYLPAGNYAVSNLVVSCDLIGQSTNTHLVFAAGAVGIMLNCTNGHDVRNIWLDGGSTANWAGGAISPGSNIGLQAYGRYNGKIENVVSTGWDNKAFYVVTDGSLTDRTTKFQIINCDASTCYKGFNIMAGAEYIRMSGCKATACMWAVYNESANIDIMDGQFNDNWNAYHGIGDGLNRGHCSITGCSFNHSDTSHGVSFLNCRTGIAFTGNRIQGSGGMFITNCAGINVTGCIFDVTPVWIDVNSGANTFMNNYVASSTQFIDYSNKLICGPNWSLTTGDVVISYTQGGFGQAAGHYFYLNQVKYTWPATQQNGWLRNDGAGNLQYQYGGPIQFGTIGNGYTLNTNDLTYVCVTNDTVTLPTAVGRAGRIYTIKLMAPATAGTVATTSSQLIDGVTTYSLSASNKFVTVQSEGTNWVIIGQN